MTEWEIQQKNKKLPSNRKGRETQAKKAKEQTLFVIVGFSTSSAQFSQTRGFPGWENKKRWKHMESQSVSWSWKEEVFVSCITEEAGVLTRPHGENWWVACLIILGRGLGITEHPRRALMQHRLSKGSCQEKCTPCCLRKLTVQNHRGRDVPADSADGKDWGPERNPLLILQIT